MLTAVNLSIGSRMCAGMSHLERSGFTAHLEAKQHHEGGGDGPAAQRARVAQGLLSPPHSICRKRQTGEAEEGCL